MTSKKQVGVTLFGRAADGSPVYLFRLTNKWGVSVDLITYGAGITRIETPDRGGKVGNIVLGYGSLEEYLNDEQGYLGCTVGRYANRIKGGRFELDGEVFQLSCNERGTHLHGGHRGFSRHVWKGELVHENEDPGVRFELISPDGEEGYPGEMHISVSYLLNGDNALTLHYEAQTTRATPLNCTNHSYFNLGADEDVLDHELFIRADGFTETDSERIPTGWILPVRSTPMDFTRPRRIGESIADTPSGYDHTFALRPSQEGHGCRLAARAVHRGSGRGLELWTTEPALQFYTGNSFDGTRTVTGGRRLIPRAGFTLEAQHFPDSPNHHSFPDTILRPGAVYEQTTIYRFFTIS